MSKESVYINNGPIIGGFSPDPSICRAGDDYYLVCSSFEFFPGVPIYHSRNLVDWTLINHCLSRKSQLNLEKSWASGGIYAPTIRYNKGTFFMITTNVSDKGNFIVHTEDIAGEWSEPVWIELESPGIDPDLFFDDDGKVYFTYSSDGEQILSCEIDPFTGKTLSSPISFAGGCGGKYPEAPHFYKRDGYYYMMLAEGGTEYGHRETIQRSRNIEGPYEKCPDNPILTHQDKKQTVQATGHGDLIEDANGNWWMVFLGVRPINGSQLHHIGRETFLTPVVWSENGWPLVGDNGQMPGEINIDRFPETPGGKSSSVRFFDDFSSGKFSPEWNFIRNPKKVNYKLDKKGKCLTLCGTDNELSDSSQSATFIGIRQRQFDTRTNVRLFSGFDDNQKGGLCVLLNHSHHYEIYLTKKNNELFLEVNRRIYDLEAGVYSQKMKVSESIDLFIESDPEDYHFLYALDGNTPIEVASGRTMGLCTEICYPMNFTGAYLGLFSVRGDSCFSEFESVQNGLPGQAG